MPLDGGDFETIFNYKNQNYRIIHLSCVFCAQKYSISTWMSFIFFSPRPWGTSDEVKESFGNVEWNFHEEPGEWGLETPGNEDPVVPIANPNSMRNSSKQPYILMKCQFTYAREQNWSGKQFWTHTGSFEKIPFIPLLINSNAGMAEITDYGRPERK